MGNRKHIVTYETRFMLKYLRIILLLPILNGCVSSTVYNLDTHINSNKLEIPIKENRKKVQLRTKQKNSKFILGDNNIVPGPKEFISSKLSEYLRPSAGELINEVSLNHFKLIIYWPNMGRVGSSAAMAGASYPAAILHDGFAKDFSYRTDGVISQIGLSINGTEYKCDTYLPAPNEVRALVGMQMDNEKIIRPLNDVLSRCISIIARKTPFGK